MITDKIYNFNHQSINDSLFKLIDNIANNNDMDKIYSYANYIRLKNNFNIDFAIFEDNVTKGLMRFIEKYNKETNDSPVILFRTIIFNDLVNFSKSIKMKEKQSHYYLSGVNDFLERELQIEDKIIDKHTIEEELLLQNKIKELGYNVLYDFIYNEIKQDDLAIKYNLSKGQIEQRVFYEKKYIKWYFNDKDKFNKINKNKTYIKKYGI